MSWGPRSVGLGGQEERRAFGVWGTALPKQRRLVSGKAPPGGEGRKGT